MNKKLLSIFLIFVMLSVSFGSVAANQTGDNVQTTSDDSQTTSQDQSTDAPTSESEQTPEVTASEDNLTDENTTENQSANNTTMTPEERAESTKVVSTGVSDLNPAEYYKFVDDITQANSNGQYDEILNILTNDNVSLDELSQALDKLSDEDYDVLSDIFEFCHDEYRSDAEIDRSQKTLDIMDDISDLNVENAENFTDILNYFNDGKFDNILNILEHHENYTILDLYQELNKLSDEDLETFFNFVQLLDDNDGDDEEIDVVSAITSIPDTINKIVNGDNGQQSSSSSHSKISNFRTQKIFKEEKDFSFDSNKIGIIRDLLNKYFSGEITFDQLVQKLNDEGIDTSELKQNPDGTLSWFGLDSIIGQDLTDDDNTNSTDDKNSTADADDSQASDDEPSDDTTANEPSDDNVVSNKPASDSGNKNGVVV